MLSLQPQSTLRASPSPPTSAGSGACRAHGLAPVLWSAVGDELPWMGLWQCQPGSESSAALLSYWPRSSLLLPSFAPGPGIHLKYKVRRAPTSFWFTKGSAGASLQQLSWLTPYVQLHTHRPPPLYPSEDECRISTLIQTLMETCVGKVQGEYLSQSRDHYERMKGMSPT